MTFISRIELFLLLLIIVVGLNTNSALAQQNLCTTAFESLTSITPLTDLGTESYIRTAQTNTYGNYIAAGGLYPGSQNTRLPDHESLGIDIANQISPINGRIAMISIGMSNTTQEFSVFKSMADSHTAKNPQLTIIDGAQGGKAVQQWQNPADSAWNTLASRLTAQNITSDQVQIAWIKLAVNTPSLFETTPGNHVRFLAEGITEVIKILKTEYPNIKIVYLTSRTRAYREDNSLNPEPFAYESNIAIREVINRQLSPESYTPDQKLSITNYPFLSWGPYIWIDGTNPRSDGHIWPNTDLVNDCTHPSTAGRQKVANQLMAFFMTDTTTTAWFLGQLGQIPGVTINASTNQGQIPLTVQFTSTSPTGSQIYWNFADGTSAIGSNVTKTYFTSGTYNVQTTFTNGGTADIRSLTIIIESNGRCLPIGDTDCNGRINAIDAAYVISKWGTNDFQANLDNTGTVTGSDMRILLSNYLR